MAVEVQKWIYFSFQSVQIRIDIEFMYSFKVIDLLQSVKEGFNPLLNDFAANQIQLMDTNGYVYELMDDIVILKSSWIEPLRVIVPQSKPMKIDIHSEIMELKQLLKRNLNSDRIETVKNVKVKPDIEPQYFITDGWFSLLPNELIYAIVSELNLKSYYSLSRSCKSMMKLIGFVFDPNNSLRKSLAACFTNDLFHILILQRVNNSRTGIVIDKRKDVWLKEDSFSNLLLMNQLLPFHQKNRYTFEILSFYVLESCFITLCAQFPVSKHINTGSRFAELEKIMDIYVYLAGNICVGQTSEEMFFSLLFKSISQNMPIVDLCFCDVMVDEAAMEDSCGVAIISCLKDNRTIKLLSFSNQYIGQDSMAKLAEILKSNNTIEDINLRHNDFTGSINSICSIIEQNSRSLKFLNISDDDSNAFEENDFDKLFNALKKNTNLKVLQMGGHSLGTTGVNSLCLCLIHNVFLQTLDLSECHMSESDLSIIASSLGRFHLKMLNLTGNHCSNLMISRFLLELHSHKTMERFLLSSDESFNSQNMCILISLIRSNKIMKAFIFEGHLASESTGFLSELKDVLDNHNKSLRSLTFFGVTGEPWNTIQASLNQRK